MILTTTNKSIDPCRIVNDKKYKYEKKKDWENIPHLDRWPLAIDSHPCPVRVSLDLWPDPNVMHCPYSVTKIGKKNIIWEISNFLNIKFKVN